MKIKVLIQPNSKINEIIGFQGDHIKIKIKAPPIEGKANLELISFLSKKLKVSKEFICLISGHSSKVKIIEISSLDNLPELSELAKQTTLEI